MQKLHVRYDIFETILECNGTVKLKRYATDVTNVIPFVAYDLTISPLCYLAAEGNIYSFLKYFIIATSGIAMTVISSSFNKDFLEYIMEDSKRKKSEFVNLLKHINIETDDALIEQIYMLYQEYCLSKEFGMQPARNRYYKIPLLDEGKTTIIREEHILGTKDYYISKEDPPKKKVLSPSFS